MSNNVIDNDAPTLETVNTNLLRKLNNIIQQFPEEVDDVHAEAILQITTAVAKLNTSYKGNDKIGITKTDQEKLDEELTNSFSGLGEGIIVDG